ncbi:MAG TPA: hypothetical protein DCF33_08880, partial [Saprospirales bacterium]|nr:hypothetical protein [Saprospirales bacterium]
PDTKYYSYTIKRSIKFDNKYFIGCQALDNQTYIPYPGWYNDQESAVFFVLDENLQTDTIMILPPSSGAYFRIEDLAIGPDSILYVSFLEKYLKSDVQVPYLEIRKVLYGFDKHYKKVFEWIGPDLDILESRTCLANSPDSTIYMNHEHNYRSYLMAMKPDGSVKWECLLDSTIGWNLYYIQRLIVAENGDIVGAGIIASVVDELGWSGFLFRVNSQGQLKWKKAIRVNKGFDLTIPAIYPYETSFEDLTELPNGDLIAVGYVRKYVDSSPTGDPYNFDIWVVRTNSEGCMWDDCPYIQDIVTKDNYIPFVTPLNEWVVDFIPPHGFPKEIRRYTFSSDSVLLDGKYYHELLFSLNMSGGPWISEQDFFREDNGKIYRWLENMPERLVYDLHFGIGDSLVGMDSNQATRYVTQVGSIQLQDDIPRKFIEFNSGCGPSRWVEGIGEMEDLLYSEVFCSLWDGIPLTIRCFSTNGQLLYQRPDISGCYTSSIQELAIDSIAVFPNPGSDVLYFRTEDASSIASLKMFNSTGSLVLMVDNQKTPIDRVDVSTLPAGFYTGMVYLGNQQVKVFKVVLER